MRIIDVPSGKVVKMLESAYIHGSPVYKEDCAKKGDIGTIIRGNRTTLVSRRGKMSFIPQDFTQVELAPELSFRVRLDKLGNTRASVSLGADPEIFVMTGDTVLPAFSFLPAKKPSPDPQIFWDGFQAEFTMFPCACVEAQVYDIKGSLQKILEKAQKLNKNAKLTAACVVDIPHDLMAACTDEQVALGCAPSLNIYSGVQPLSVEGRQVSIRFAGYHMHFGVKELHNPEPLKRAVKFMDAIYGVASVSLLEGVEDKRRRQFYGKAGEYRLPKHGLEYRVPSSSILCHPVLVHLSLDLTRFAMLAGLNDIDTGWDTGGEDRVQHIINNLDVQEARRTLETNKAVLEDILTQLYGERQSKVAYTLLSTGARNHIQTENVEETWDLHEEGPSSAPMKIGYLFL